MEAGSWPEKPAATDHAGIPHKASFTSANLNVTALLRKPQHAAHRKALAPAQLTNRQRR
jgi:hypothetical protein